MSLLQEFLVQHPIDNTVVEVIVSDRFKDKDGNILKFKIRPVTGPEYAEYQRASTTINRHRKIDFNSKKFNELMIINHTIDPSFKDADSIRKLGCTTPEDFLYKCLLAGEIQELSNQISKISGFDTDMEELREEAKNS